jgi:hypothetical protein
VARCFVQHVHKYATPLHAMASAVVQSRTADGQDDDNVGLDDAVWDALQDSDEVRCTLRIHSPAMWVAIIMYGSTRMHIACFELLHWHALLDSSAGAGQPAEQALAAQPGWQRT